MAALSEPKHLTSRAFVALQYLLPQHFFSRLVWRATRSRNRRWKNFLIRRFLRHYPIDMSEALEPDPYRYPTFNEFFTRALKSEARPLDANPASLISPVDGVISQIGHIEGDMLLQAKGHHYTTTELLGGREALAQRFQDGAFATLYLAPHHYHRVHMPVAGRLISTHYIPGRLFSVNRATTRRVPRLFARNERIICIFEGACGQFAVILVGALFVGSMSTTWAAEITPTHPRRPTELPLPAAAVHLLRGAELGRFNMGSTVILLFEPGRVQWREELAPGTELRMGTAIADPMAQERP